MKRPNDSLLIEHGTIKANKRTLQFCNAYRECGFLNYLWNVKKCIVIQSFLMHFLHTLKENKMNILLDVEFSKEILNRNWCFGCQ